MTKTIYDLLYYPVSLFNLFLYFLLFILRANNFIIINTNVCRIKTVYIKKIKYYAIPKNKPRTGNFMLS